MNMNISEQITAIGTVIVAVITTIIAVLQRINGLKLSKKNDVNEQEIEKLKAENESANRAFELYENELMEFMALAEDQGLKGQSKKLFVKSQIIMLCQIAGIKYDDRVIDTLIEKLIVFSKAVNFSKKLPIASAVKKED